MIYAADTSNGLAARENQFGKDLPFTSSGEIPCNGKEAIGVNQNPKLSGLICDFSNTLSSICIIKY